MTARLNTTGVPVALLALTLVTVTSTAAAHAKRWGFHCTTVPRTGDTAQWRSVRDGLYFSVRWNPQFQTYELLWANRTPRNVRVEFVMQPRTAAATAGARWLAARTQETLPGQSVRPSANGAVCLELARAAY